MISNILEDPSPHSQHMKVSRWFALFIFVCSSVLAFVLGWAARIGQQLPLIRDEQGSNAHSELDLNQTLHLINLRKEAYRNQVLLWKQPRAASKSRSFDAPCYEALVHPGVISHPDPKRVAIIGNGEGVVQEVLKHRDIHAVKIFAMDDENSLRSSLYEGSRVEVGRVESMLQVSIPLRKNPTSSNDTTLDADVFDVMIIQSFPKEFVLSTDTSFFRACYDALSNNGVLVLPLGAVPDEDGERKSKSRMNLIDWLIGLGFASIHVYEDGHCEFVEPRSVLVAFKEYKTRSNWYRNAAQIQIQLHQRLQATRSGKSPLIYFDSLTMMNYQVPSKTSENIYCLDYDQDDCDYHFGSLPADTVDVPVSHFEVRKSRVSEMAGRGVFAVRDIPRHASIALELTVKNFCVMPSTWAVIDSLYSRGDEKNGLNHKNFEGLVYYIQGYGYGSQLWGETHWTIDSWMLLFSNHGCNGTFNYGAESTMWSELTVDIDKIPKGLDGSKAVAYSPFQERHLRAYSGSGDYTLRDIKAGEEVLTNYVSFVDPSEWTQEILILQSQCAGEEVGEITDYESGGKSYF